MFIVYRTQSVGGHIEDFQTQGAAIEFCRKFQEYRYVGRVYRFFKGKQ